MGGRLTRSSGRNEPDQVAGFSGIRTKLLDDSFNAHFSYNIPPDFSVSFLNDHFRIQIVRTRQCDFCRNPDPVQVILPGTIVPLNCSPSIAMKLALIF